MNQAQQLGEQSARLSALEKHGEDMHADVSRIFQAIEALRVELAGRPVCADPAACTRVEKALADQNKRLVALELARQRNLGELTAIGVTFTAIGTAVGWFLELWHKT